MITFANFVRATGGLREDMVRLEFYALTIAEQNIVKQLPNGMPTPWPPSAVVWMAIAMLDNVGAMLSNIKTAMTEQQHMAAAEQAKGSTKQ